MIEITDYNLITPNTRIPVNNVEIRKEKRTDVLNVHHLELSPESAEYLEGRDNYVAEIQWSSKNGGLENSPRLKQKTFIRWVSGKNVQEYLKNEGIYESVNIDFKDNYNYLIYNTPSYEQAKDDVFRLGFYSDHNILDYFNAEEITWNRD